MKQYKMFELAFSGDEPKGSWAQAEINAVFTCEETTVTVKGFYDGNGIYKIRFLPRQAGMWHWEVSGAVTASGQEECVADEHFHGIVKVEDTHFVHEDGTKYLPFGTTVYALAHQQDEIVEQTMQTLSEAPFNKVRMCVFPKHYDLVKAEPPLHPFEKKGDDWDVHKPNYAFWHRFESFLDRLEELDIQVDLILFHPYDRWGYCTMSQEENLVYLDTVMRRLSARPNIWWSLANEYDILAWDMEKWYEIEESIVANDPYGHLLSNHNCTATYDYTRPNVSHVCVQTRWIEKAGEWVQEYGKPVIYDEMCYEGNLVFPWGNISGPEMVHRFWTVCANGAYGTHGDTFMDENDIIWWACGGTLKGQSAPRIAFLKEILYSLPGILEPVKQRGMGDLITASEEELDFISAHFPNVKNMAYSLRRMEPGMRHVLISSETMAKGHCGEDAYLNYYGHFCSYQGTLDLPQEGSYRVEVIDAWNMTRNVVYTGVNGTVDVPLPSKEYMAILAVREQ